MTEFDDLSLLVVNFGSTELLRANLLPLTGEAPGLHVVVVDNLSTDAERDALVALAATAGWSTVLPGTNEGFGAGMNRAAARAQELGARHHLLVNPDAVVTVDSLRSLHAYSREHVDRMASPRILRPDGSTWFDGSDLYLADGRIRSRRRRIDGARVRPWLSGACLIVSDDLWRRAGGFDEDYFLYWEDVDLSQRVEDAGGTLEVLSDVTVVHAEGGTQAAGGAAPSGGAVSAGEAKSDTYYFYNIRNRMLYAAKHLDDADLAAWGRESRRVAWEILLQGGRRQFLRSPGTLLVGLRALGAGRRIAAEEQRRRAARPPGR